MHVAFDIDGTLTAHPKAFASLMSSLKASGHQVTVLTGSIGQGDMTARQNQLNGIGITANLISNLVNCAGDTIQQVADGKGDYCLTHQVDMIFEDSPLYLASVRRISPQTCCFQILPIGGP